MKSVDASSAVRRGRMDSGLDTSADWAPAEGAARSFMLFAFREDLLTAWPWALKKARSGRERF